GRAIDTFTVVDAGSQANGIRRSEPMIDVLSRVGKPGEIAVRPVGAAGILAAGGPGHQQTDREARVRLEYVVGSPASQDRVHGAVPTGAEDSLSPERQIIMCAGAEKMRGVEEPESIIAAPVISVFPVCALAIGAAVAVV